MTVEFIAFSDAHIHDFSFGAKYVSREANDLQADSGSFLVNSRLHYAINACEEVLSYASDNDISIVLFCGDWFHSKRLISKSAVTLSTWLVAEAARRGIRIVAIPGNHDYEDKFGTMHSLLPFEAYESFTILTGEDENEELIYDSKHKRNICVRGMPYTEDKAKLLEFLNSTTYRNRYDDPVVTLFHAGVQGAKVGSDFIMKKAHDIHPDEINPAASTMFLAGHYHLGAKLWSNGWMVGATHQIDWSDANSPRGFIHVTIDDDNVPHVQHVPVSRDVPHFHVLDSIDEIKTADVRVIDFVKVKVEESITDDLMDTVKGYFAAVLEDSPAYLELVPVKKTEAGEESLSEKALSPTSVIDEWVDLKAKNLDPVKLKELGHKFIQKARSESDE